MVLYYTGALKFAQHFKCLLHLVLLLGSDHIATPILKIHRQAFISPDVINSAVFEAESQAVSHKAIGNGFTFSIWSQAKTFLEMGRSLTRMPR